MQTAASAALADVLARAVPYIDQLVRTPRSIWGSDGHKSTVNETITGFKGLQLYTVTRTRGSAMARLLYIIGPDHVVEALTQHYRSRYPLLERREGFAKLFIS